ncbi:MAG: MCP four helix bundle domain-containing protein [Betaproteobacteria bacterium]|nr:MCP four helix bundle domain-containing protein [Betaproteobacteria bacterium]
MNAHKKLTLSGRLGLGIAGILVLVLGASLYALLTMRSLAEKTALLYKHPMTVTNAILAVDGDLIRMHRGIKDVALAQSSEEIDKAVATINANEQKVKENMQIVRDRFLGPRQMIDDIQRAIDDWTVIRTGTIVAAREGNKAEAALRSKTIGANQTAEINAAVSALRDWAKNKGADFVETAQKSYETAIYTFIAINLLILIASVAISWLMIRSVTRPLGGEPEYAQDAIRRIAAGDLSVPVAVKAGDNTSLLALIQNMQVELQRIVSTIRQGVDSVSDASTEIASGNRDLSARTEQQASNLQQTAATIEDMTNGVKTNANNATQANQLAASASEVAAKGGTVAVEVVHTMDGINNASKKIAEIIGVIDSIAFQTNILALNAAVEAARAGEQGRGFAVVASEVRNLAQRSAEAAREIRTLISDSVERVEAGSKLVNEAGKTMSEIVTQVRRVSDLIGEITATTVEQSSGISQVNQAVTQLDQVTQQNAALAEQSSAAAESLRDQAAKLTAAVSVFQLQHA